MISTSLRHWFAEPDDKDSWQGEWDLSCSDLAPAGDPTSPLEAARLSAAHLRSFADANVEHRYIVFVRHAQPSQEVSEGGIKVLTEEGLRQAELTGQRLRELFGTVSTIYHSGAGEARATAAALRGCLGSDTALRESALFAEGLPVVPSPRPTALGDVSDEELANDAARSDGAFHALMWRPSGANPERVTVEVVVSHGNMIRYLACRALQMPPAAWSRLAAYHCAMTWLDLDCEGGVTLREFGGVGHLPRGLVTYT